MLVQAAINGTRARAAHPALPVTPAEQAVAAVESVAAGAGAIHLHVRGADGRESLAAGDVALALRAIRAAAPGVPVGVSTGAWIIPDPDLRFATAAAWTVLPDYVSVNFHEDGAAALTDSFLARAVGVEAGLSTVRAAELFATSGLAGRCLRILLEPGERDIEAALATVGAVEKVLNGTRVKLRRLLHGTDGTAWPLIDAAAARGYDTRVGFEDTLALPDGARAPSNAALVAAACRRVVQRP